MFIVFNLQTAVTFGVQGIWKAVSKLKWLKRRRNLFQIFNIGSLILNMDPLLDLIKEISLFLKTAIDFEFCISAGSCDRLDREF